MVVHQGICGSTEDESERTEPTDYPTPPKERDRLHLQNRPPNFQRITPPSSKKKNTKFLRLSAMQGAPEQLISNWFCKRNISDGTDHGPLNTHTNTTQFNQRGEARGQSLIGRAGGVG